MNSHIRPFGIFSSRTLFCVWLIVIITVGGGVPAFARGTQEEAWEEVDGTENWQHEFDISEHDPGRHNIVVRAFDLAGNMYEQGPFDIDIDPESDLPVVNFVYPEPDQVVRTNVNVVGSAVDDDAVASVEYRVNEGPWREADGTSHWSSVVNADTLPDGRHTVEARATDIYGTQGHEASVEFILDTEPPTIGIESHSGGDIVTGRVAFEGTAFDDNDIDEVAVSRDGGSTWERERARYDSELERWTFDVDVRTQNLDDGPHVFWLRATNTTGAYQEEPFLFYVNNEGPAIEVIEPESETAGYGIVHVAGQVNDLVGVERLWYEWDGEEIDIPLAPGNSFWHMELDVTGERGRWINIPIHTQDVSGNVTTLDYRPANEPERAQPTVEIVSPDIEAINEAGETLAFDDAIYGEVTGEYEAEAIIVEGLEDSEVEIPAFPSFRIPLRDAEPGGMDLRIRARNELGIEGEEVRLRFDRRAKAADVVLESLVYDDNGETVSFESGMGFDPLRGGELRATAETDAGIDEVTAFFGRSAEALDDMDRFETPEDPDPDTELWSEARVRTRSGDEPDTTNARIEIPADAAAGLVPVVIRVIDDSGTSVLRRALLDIEDLRRISGEPRIVLDGAEIADDGTVRLFGDRPLYGRVVGESGGSDEERIESVTLEPEQDGVQIRRDGAYFEIHAAQTGVWDWAELVARTASGLELSAGDLRFMVDTGSRDTSVLITEVGEGEAFQQGFPVAPGDRPDIAGTVTAQERPDDLVLYVDDEQVDSSRLRGVDDRDDRWSFSLRLPRGLTHGERELRVAALSEDEDVLDEHVARFFVLDDEPAPANTDNVLLVDPQPLKQLGDLGARSGLTNEQSDADPAREYLESGSRPLFIETGESVAGLFDGRPLDEVRFVYDRGEADAGNELVSPEEVLSLRADGRRIELFSTGSGITLPFRLEVTTVDGLEHRSEQYQAVVRSDELILDVDTSGEGRYLNESLQLSATVSDPVLEPRVAYRLDLGESWVPFQRNEDGSFSTEVFLDVLESAGAKGAFIRAEGALGRLSEQWLPYNYDAASPNIDIITPRSDDVVAGVNGVFGRVDSVSPITALSYSVDDGETWESLAAADAFYQELDFSQLERDGMNAIVRAEDAAGNEGRSIIDIDVDLDLDMPEVEIQTPDDGAVITSDVSISGTAFDRTGVSDIFWRIVVPDEDPPDFERLPGSNSFDIELSLSDLVDNEQEIQVYAVNDNDRESELETRTINVSLREPVIDLQQPHVDDTHRRTVEIAGTARDENGIAEVHISFDNGNSYHEVDGLEGWSYELDSRIFPDGTYPIEVRAVDELGVVGRFFSLVNVDNTPPDISLSQPENSSVVSGVLRVNGRVEDNRELSEVRLLIEPLNMEGDVFESELGRSVVLHDEIDVSELASGWYTATIEAEDEAGNTRSVSRTIHIEDELESTSVYVLFPEPGETRHGSVQVQGRVVSPFDIRSVQIYVDDSFVDGASVDELGYFRHELSNDQIGRTSTGEPEEIAVHAVVETGEEGRTSSQRRRFRYQPDGPALSIESHELGEFISERPWLEGDAVFASATGAGNGDADVPEVTDVSVSLDNGVTFDSARGDEQWRYRLPTHEMNEGPIRILVRAEYENGETAYTRTLLMVDRTAPQLNVRSPSDGDVVNTRVAVFGTAEDDYEIDRIETALRPGGGGTYGVPEFIQGMYFDLNAMGITYADAGLGFSFFDDNVRLQGQYGITPEGQRFSGQVVGGKIIANIASVPFSSFLGPDWDFLSATLALGANFSYIHLNDPLPGSDERGVVLSAIVGQLEFPRVEISQWDAFNSYSLYTEPEIWFVPSDVEPTIEPRMSFGLRVGLF